MHKQNKLVLLFLVFIGLGCGKYVPNQELTNELEKPAASTSNEVVESITPEVISELKENSEISITSIKILEEKGGRLSLSSDGTIIAYDKRGADKYFDIWTMSSDGQNQNCLTCNHPVLPTRNVGQPDWHPSDDYLVVQVEKPEHHEGIASALGANPGAGLYNDLWIIEFGSDRAWPINVVPEGKGHGVLHPHFSSDGKMLSWAQSYRDVDLTDPARIGGSWDLRVADVLIDSEGVMSIANIRIIQPGEDVWYENHGFSPDGQKLIFTSNLTGDQSFASSDIYTFDLFNNELERLTDTGYNEHAQYSPDGSKIIWMTTNENIPPEEVIEVTSTDWWIMNTDGSDKQRLTYFNQEDHPHFIVWGTVAADFAWLPQGNGFIGYYHTFGLENLLQGEYREVIVRLEFGDQ